MKKVLINVVAASLIAVIGFGIVAANTYAEEANNEGKDSSDAPKTSLTLTPVSKTLDLSSNSTYDGTLSVSNDGTDEMQVEVYAAPYSYVYSSEDDIYKLGFNNENNFTQISRWIKIKDASENYVEHPIFKIPANETIDIDYRVTTPSNIPAGGQYAVILVQTMSGDPNASGIRTEASAGMIVYGHSTEGEAIISSEISAMSLSRDHTKEGNPDNSSVPNDAEKNKSNNNFFGSAKVKNTGNVDFFAKGTLKAEPIIGFSSYESPVNNGVVSVIPESERIVSDEWTETPDFGVYKVTWTVEAGENSETIEQIVFLANPLVVILCIIALTILVVSIIIGVRKRKERRSRLAV